MPESSALPLQVVEVLARGWTVITSNQRAARTLRRAFGLQQRAQARTSWEPPAILAWESWLTSLHHQMLLTGHSADLLLNASQEHALWLAVIGADAATSSLRPLDALADAAAEAWALLHTFRGRSHLGRYPGNSDTRVFARWTYDFERRLKRGQYLTVAQLPERLAEAVRRNEVTLPAGVLLVGFDSQSPAQQALLAAIAEAGADLTSVTMEPPASGPRLAATKSEEEELLACAHWARAALVQDSGLRIAVVVPSIEPLRSEIDRVFRQVLAPELNEIGSPAAASPFEFSLGQPLTRSAMIATALDVLRWSQGPIPLDRISSLLLSPYFAVGGSEERIARAEFDAYVCRQQTLVPRLTLSAVARLGARWKGAPSIAGLMRHLATLRVAFGAPELPLLNTHNAWAETVAGMLAAAAWATPEGLDSFEFQTRRKWESTLDELATLDFDNQLVPFGQALASLEQIASQTLFAPESRHAPVQIVGPLESAGSQFDAIWFLRANDAEWSTTRGTNPLLPWQLQRALNMPGVAPAQDVELARSITRRIAASVPKVIFSYAREASAGAQRPSPALAVLDLEPVEAEAFLPSTERDKAIPLELLAREPELPPPPDAVLQGGASVLEKQAACAFRAFAEVRLFSSTVDPAVLGLDAGERGSIVHRVLQLFWSSVSSQAELRSHSIAVRNEVLDNCIDRALTEKTRAQDPGWPQAYMEAERQRLRNLLRPWLDYEAQQRSEFLVKDLESEYPDVRIGPLRLHVKVDRVDTWLEHGKPAGDLILDYKTGMAKPAQWVGDRPDAPQLPLYAVVAGSSELAGIAFASVRPGTKREIRGYQSKKNVLPKTVREAPTDLNAQVEEWRRVLAALASDFHAGKTEVRPKNYPETCRYCQQRLLCRLDVAALSADETEEVEDLSPEEDYG